MVLEPLKKSLFLKNARMGECYDSFVELDGLSGIRLFNDGGSGLAYEESSGMLTGTPLASGDFCLIFRGVLHGKSAEITAQLAVIPDPRSLWVNHPSPRDAPFWKPEEDFQQLSGELLCVAASKRGRSHAREGSFRDDDFGLLASSSSGWYIAAVADGAGSAPYARRGSKLAVDTVLSKLPPLLEQQLTPRLESLVQAHRQGHPDAGQEIRRLLYTSLVTTAFEAAKAIETEAAIHQEKPSAFSTTLIVCVMRRLARGWFSAGFSIGDGGAAIFDLQDGSLAILTAPDSGEFAGQTRFLQRAEFGGGFEDLSRRLFFDIREQFTALAVMTDGISDPKFPTEVAFADPARWISFWKDDLSASVRFARDNPELKQQFLDWLDFWSIGNHDDRTLALLMP
ncbi:MAG: protein phosphatase 2C domain-containing protein [Magnetococcus sp. YQC-9]